MLVFIDTVGLNVSGTKSYYVHVRGPLPSPPFIVCTDFTQKYCESIHDIIGIYRQRQESKEDVSCIGTDSLCHVIQ